MVTSIALRDVMSAMIRLIRRFEVLLRFCAVVDRQFYLVDDQHRDRGCLRMQFEP